MPENDEGVTPDDDQAAEVEETQEEDEELPQVEAPSDGDPDRGAKAALVAERESRRKERAERRTLKAEVESLRQQLADSTKTPDEQALDQARREAAAEATKTAHTRLLKAEVRAAAKGRLADPADALAYLDLEEFEVTDDGDIDSESIEDAISDLLTRKPYLAGETRKFQGSADQGAKGRKVKPTQLSRDDLKKLTPAQIIKADQDGRLDGLKGIK